MTNARRKLILIRHAKSAHPDGAEDFDRPLADRGRRDAPAVGRWLRDNAYAIEAVRCSPALRTRQTWELARTHIPAEPQVRFDERIYDATAQRLLEIVRELPVHAMTAALVGHNPGLEDLVHLLTGEPVQLKTSAVALLSSERTWAEVGESWTCASTFAKPRG
ncbi:histidine phosphatase family protein [Saccharopolyspora rhizosphaerae]|uniref:Histidine phosphatase family protein n=1 Tax=Saccharopolyspora rhizosphaerae TaxID=2492662 RepID=A0A3R8PXY4_9PSEU|nr:histidine phosphatase family protein [Saccharopolyspora rhizosphaerae]RRO14287.1 histidine phosphatase family protein [Saccharopolyspora rhizosphaerae]